jgi:hypothetical protein
MSRILISMVPIVFSLNVWADPNLKNFRQLNSSLSNVTGVSTADPDVATTFSSVRTRLPQTGAVEEMSSPMLMGMFSLAGIYCRKMINDDSTKPVPIRRVHHDVDFSPGMRRLTQDMRMSVIDEYANLFWQRSLSAEETQLMYQAMDASTVNQSLSLPDRISLLLTTCTIFGSSLEFMIL